MPTRKTRGLRSLATEVAPRLPVRMFIANEMIERAFGHAVLESLESETGQIVAVVTPPSWRRTVIPRLLDRFPGAVYFTPPTRRDQLERDLEGFLDQVAEGCVGIAYADFLDDLPVEIRASADLTIHIELPNGEILRSAVRQFCTVDPGPLPYDLGRNANPTALVACFRSGANAERVVARLLSLEAGASLNLPSGPRLEDLHGYGEAALWADSLRNAVERFKAGEIAFSDIPLPAVILAGPPGTGKTQFAKALARTLRLPLHESSVADWFASSSGYLDGVVKQIEALFASARASADAGCGLAIVFLDEIDAIPSRDAMESRNSAWWTTMVTHILRLTEISSPARRGLILVGATNHPEALDPALTRSGRFERVIPVPLPDAQALTGILGTHAPEIDEPSRAALAPLLVGRTGADVASTVKAAREFAQTMGRQLTPADLREAMLPPDGLLADERLSIAIHEAGHAVVAHTLGIPVDLVTIVPSESGAGHVDTHPRLVLPGREELEALATVGLAGRAAEVLFSGKPTSGAEGDLEKVTALVARMHLRQGLGDRLVSVPESVLLTMLAHDPRARGLIESEMRKLLARATAILRANAEGHARLVRQLLSDRLVPGGRLAAILLKKADGLDQISRRGERRRAGPSRLKRRI